MVQMSKFRVAVLVAYMTDTGKQSKVCEVCTLIVLVVWLL
jgi:hypothetical protein